MGNGFRWFTVVLMLALAATVGVFTYNLGFAHGLSQAAPAVTAPTVPGVVPYAFYPRPWGWGMGFFPIFGLFWAFLLFAILRRIWWGPRWYGLRYGPYGYDRFMAPEFEEWHRRAHAGKAPEPTKL